MATMPESMRKVFYEGAPLTSTLSVSDEEFIKYARMTSGLYQTASRWKMMERYLPALQQKAARDIRGYHYLNNLENVRRKITIIDSLPDLQQRQILMSIVGICFNAVKNKDQCEKSILDPANRSILVQAYDLYIPIAKQVWDSFFKISNPRTDITWSAFCQNKLEIPFKKIVDPDIAEWLKSNVEYEFKWEDEHFSMEVNYVTTNNFGTSYLEFKAGATPHVSGGNKIVMDGNTDIQEYNIRWTIRHEFGHILRIPDCYTEFYDATEMVMVNYQLDVDDLMCSRKGVMNKRIYDELKEKYRR